MERSFLRNERKPCGSSSTRERHAPVDQQVMLASPRRAHAVRAEIRRSFGWQGICDAMSREAQASLAQLSKKLGINPKSVAKWPKRTPVEDLKTGPKEPRSTVLTESEEAMIVAFRRHTRLPLDDCLYAPQPSLPHPTQSALHRCLQRHGISRLPDVEGDKSKRQQFKRYPIHCPAVHVYMHERGLLSYGDLPPAVPRS